jgi:small conductance mechanosensitive channel
MQLLTPEQLYDLGIKVAVFLIILGATAVLVRLLRGIFSRVHTTSPQIAINIQHYVYWLVWFIGIVFALSQLGLSVDILLLIITLIGILIIIAGRDALKNLSARLFLDLYTQYKVGDKIMIQEFNGKVVEINPISTILANEKNELINIPNALFLSDIMVNKTSGRGWEITVPILIDKKVDVIEFEEALLDVCKNIRRYLKKGKQPTCATTKIDEHITEITVMVTLRNPENKAVVVEEIHKRAKEILDEMAEKNAEEQ